MDNRLTVPKASSLNSSRVSFQMVEDPESIDPVAGTDHAPPYQNAEIVSIDQRSGYEFAITVPIPNEHSKNRVRTFSADGDDSDESDGNVNETEKVTEATEAKGSKSVRSSHSSVEHDLAHKLKIKYHLN
jgi:hypothetical protein